MAGCDKFLFEFFKMFFGTKVALLSMVTGPNLALVRSLLAVFLTIAASLFPRIVPVAFTFLVDIRAPRYILSFICFKVSFLS